MNENEHAQFIMTFTFLHKLCRTVSCASMTQEQVVTLKSQDFQFLLKHSFRHWETEYENEFYGLHPKSISKS